MSIANRLSETAGRSDQQIIFGIRVDIQDQPLQSPEIVVSMINQAGCECLGYEFHEIIQKPLRKLTLDDQQYQRLCQYILNAQYDDKHHQDVKIVLQTGSGEAVDMTVDLFAVEDRFNHPSFVCLARRVTPYTKHLEHVSRLADSVEQSPSAVMIADTDGKIEYANPKFAELTGYQSDELIGKNTNIFQSGRTASLTYREIWETIQSGDNWQGEILNKKKSGEFYWAFESISSITNSIGETTYYLAIQEDITLRKKAEEALAESEAKNRLIVDKALDAIIMINDEGVIIDWNPKAVVLFGLQHDEAIGRQLEDTIIPKRFREAHRNGLQHLKNTGIGPVLNKLMEVTALHQEGREFPVELFITPFRIGEIHAFCGFVRDISERKRAEDRIKNYEIKLAVAQNEMRIARQIQESLHPQPSLCLDDIEIYGRCLPAAQVGGDYFDYFSPDSERVDVAIADVSGHSVGPGLFMVEARCTLRAQSRDSRLPAETLSIMNDLLFEDLSRADYFLTMFYLQYQRTTRQLSYSNAGHITPLLLRCGDDHCESLDSEGMVIGVRKSVEFEQKQVTLNRGDLLLLYTDGVIEAENVDGQFFGRKRLCQILCESAPQSADKIIDSILTRLKSYCKAKVFKDDLTMILMRVN